MDYLDPQKQRRHSIQLMIGYVFVAIAVLICTIVLLYEAFGFGRGKNGEIVQSGFVYVSSQPAGAQIRLNNQLNKAQTNTRLSLVSGRYDLQINRTGYRQWQRPINVVGGSVENFDYPFLFPTALTSTTVGKAYDAAPGLATQSPDRRWLLVQQAGSPTSFDEYDLKNPKTAAAVISLPTSVVTTGITQSWQLMEWSTDNRHVLLKHTYDDKSEFVMVDRTDPTQSVNLNTALKLNPTKLSLINKKYDQYYVYDASSQDLQTVSLSDTTPKPLLEHVLDYKSYGSNDMLYASSNASGSDKVSIDLLQDGKTYALREVAANSTYLLNLTQYDGDWYIAAGASVENKVFVYKDPVTQLNSKLGALVPVYVLKAPTPSYLAFSDNAQYIMDENGSQFSVYDVKNDAGYTYDTKMPVDTPQPHAGWMDGDRLTYISNGKLLVFDYDHANPQTLVTANSSYQPFFDPAYKFVDIFGVPATDGKVSLTTTPLLTPADQ